MATKKKTAKKESQVEDATVLEETTGLIDAKEDTREVKDVSLDTDMSLHRFLAKTGNIDAFVGTPPKDFVADNYYYDATRFYVVITPDNKVYIVEKAFFDRFFSLKHDIKE